MSPVPSISVVVPVYNGRSFLADAIRSILGQSVPPGEVLVVDDGSTDGSLDVARAFAAPVRVLQQSHAGAGPARNRGIAAAAGDLLAFHDADDLMTEDRLAIQTELLQSDPALDLVFGRQFQFVHGDDPLAALRVGNVPAARLSTGMMVGAMLCRRAIFDKVGLFESCWSVGEFINWFARARDAGVSFARSDRVVVCRRIHGHNMTLRARPGDYAQMVKGVLDRRRARGQQP